MKTKHLVFLNHFSGWRSRRHGKTLNLLNWDRPKNANRSTVYWMSLFVAIFAHGALLTYLVGFAHWPDDQGRGSPPRFITVELAGNPDRRAAVKSDREDLAESEQADVASETSLSSVDDVHAATTVADFVGELPEDRGAPHDEPAPIAQSYAVWEHGALPEDGLVRSQVALPVEVPRKGTIAVKILPEDLAVENAEAATSEPWADKRPISKADQSAPQIAQKIVEARDTPVAVSGLAHKKESQDSIIVNGGRMTALLPEDAVTLPEPHASGEQASASRADSIRAGNNLAGAPKKAATVAVPIPARKFASAADLLLMDETGATIPAKIKPEKPASHAALGMAKAYLAKVRAHLADRKPLGGLGSGTVIVEFAVSGRGEVSSARIIQSSGKSALDERVMDAVRQAAPFPKPPRNLSSSQRRFTIPFLFE